MTLLAIAISGAFATAMAQSTGRGPREFTLKIPTDYGSTGTSDTCNKDRYGFSFNEPVLDNGTVTCTGKDYAATTSVEVQLKDGTIITEAVSLDKATKLNMKVKDVESFSCEVIKL